MVSFVPGKWVWSNIFGNMLPLLSKDESYLLEVVDGSVLQLLSGDVNFSVLVFLRVGVWCGVQPLQLH